MCLLNVDCCADNSLGLHLCNLRIGNSQTASTMTHHRVELVQRSDDILNGLNALALCISQFLNIFLCGRNELV